jgi:hypothetical protein
MLIVAGFLTGCAIFPTVRPYPIQLCPQACKPAAAVSLYGGRVYGGYSPSGSWRESADADAFSDCLVKQKIYYWLTDSAGRPVTSYGMGVDALPIFQSIFSALDPLPNREHPAHIRFPIWLNRFTSDVVIHVLYTNSEENIDLRKSTLEHHDGFDVLYIK